jgi:peptidoglycan/LPS O-acetylase OafA/YrhL
VCRFVLVGGYGRTRWARFTWLGEKAGESEALPMLNARRFLARRFARLAPVYYLTNLLWLPMFSAVSGTGLRT